MEETLEMTLEDEKKLDTEYNMNKPLASYLNQIEQANIHLDKQEELSLIERFQESGDVEARNLVVYSNLKFVVYMGKKWFKSGLDCMEIISAGNEGLIKAVGNFDTNRGIDFRTFAANYITGYIQRLVADATSDGLSFELARLRNQVKIITDRIGRTSGLTYAELQAIADELNSKITINHRDVTAEDVKGIIEFSAPRSLNEFIMQDSYSVELEDTVVDTDSEDKFDMAENRMILRKLFDGLNDREKKVVYMHFFEDKSLTSISDTLHCTRQQVSLIKISALKKMKKLGCSMGLDNEC